MQQKSSHWRLTCGFEKHGIDYRDYVRAKISALDMITYDRPGTCTQVELINIRGNFGSNINVPFWQDAVNGFHTDSAEVLCDYNGSSGSVTSEDNFGWYYSCNNGFRCTESPNGTTQLWFGTYV